MKRTLPACPVQSSGGGRGGATLTEVLMSLMIMGIGLVTVATLFPISLLRAVQATHLTHSAILSYNARNLLATQRTTLDALIPRQRPGQQTRVYIFDPLGWHRMASATTTAADQWVFSDSDGALNANNPQAGTWLAPYPQPQVVGEVTRLPFAVTILPAGTYMFDTNGDGACSFLHYSSDPTATEPDARDLVMLPDSYVNYFDAVMTVESLQPAPSPYTGSIGVKLANVGSSELFDSSTTPATPYLPFRQYGVSGGVGARRGVRSRVVLFDANDTTGRTSAAYEITNIGPDGTLYWTEDVVSTNGTLDVGEDFNANGVLDMNAVPFPISEVRVETQDMRYTWMLTVRRSESDRSGQVQGDVVVFFNRRFTRDDEARFAAVFPFPKARNTMALPAGVSPPNLKRGGFVFDVINGYWFRVLDFQEDPSTGITYLTLDQSAPGDHLGTQLVFMQGVIDHYPFDSLHPVQ